MERDFDTFDPNEALVDEGRNLYYPAFWRKGDPVFVLNDRHYDDLAEAIERGQATEAEIAEYNILGEIRDSDDPFEELEQRKGLDCE